MTRGFLLDTNIPSEQTRPRPDPRVTLWLGSQSEKSLFVSAITLGEVRQGIALKPEGKRRSELEQWFAMDLLAKFVDRILPVTQSIAERWGVLSATRRLAGTPLEIADGLIAATALEHDLTLVTRNTKDFFDLGVALLNPWER